MPLSHLPAPVSAWCCQSSGARDRRSAPRRLRRLLGALCARGRRTGTAWFRAAGITADCRRAYNALGAAGRRADLLARGLLLGALQPLMRARPGGHLLFGLDDTPTARYGPSVQGAGVHPNPTPGPAGERFVYGHVWGTRAWLARPPLGPTLARPLRALLYVRARDVPALAKHYPGAFRTQLPLAAALVAWLGYWVGGLGKALWLAADGADAQRPFLKPVLALGVVVFRRRRQDADRRCWPPAQRRRGQRGPRPRYGQEKIDLAKRAGQQRGWQRVACVQYGRKVTKEVQTFLATWRPAGGVIRVVLVREAAGGRAFFGTDPAVPAAAVLEVMADRGAIEQAFKEVKEVWGAGQQPVRNVDASIGAFAVNLVLYRAVEAWAWAQAEAARVDRPAWDGEGRRPSHADKRRALPREIRRGAIQAAVGDWADAAGFRQVATRLLDLAV